MIVFTIPTKGELREAIENEKTGTLIRTAIKVFKEN